MARFIKIFTIMTGLTLMTACGASGVLDDLKSILDQAQAALAAQEVTGRFLDDKIVEERFAALSETEQTPERRAEIEAEVKALVGEERAAAREAVEDEVDKDSADYKAALAREVQYLAAVAGLNEEQQEARLITCRGTPDAAGCAGVLVRWCYETPFDTACNVNPDATRREEYITECGVGTNVGCIEDAGAVCTGGSNITGCGAFVTRVCGANPLYDVCDNADYFLARDDACYRQGINGGTRTTQCAEIFRVNNLQANAEPACRANYVAPTNENRSNRRCFNAVTAVCNLNPFDSFCQYNRNLFDTRPARILACRDEVEDAPFCDHAKTFICDTNPFDVLCRLDYTTNTYASERQTAINDCQTTFVAGEVCAGAAEQFCTGKTLEADLFNSLCLTHSGTDTARKPLCDGEKDSVTDAISARCTTTALRICGTIATALDPFCDGVDGYFDVQLSACVLDSNNPSCVVGSPTQFAALEPIAACLATPFAAACLNTATPQGMLFAPRAEAAQDAYCEAGTLDQVNCTNIGSLPVFASLARNITKAGIRTFSSDENPVVTNEVNEGNPNIGGFLRTGVFGTKLGDHKGTGGATFTDENNNGNFDRETDLGGAWTGNPTLLNSFFAPLGSGGSPGNIWDVASTTDPNDGFTYFIVTHDYSEIGDGSSTEDNDVFAYAGIWQTTNFGAPLAVRPAVDNANVTAIWAGNFTGYSGGVPRLTAKPTNFYVDFTDGTFNIHNPDGTDNNNPDGTAPKTGVVGEESRSGGAGPQSYVSANYSYTVNGIFGTDKNDPNVSYTNGGVARTLNAGELSGNVTLVNTQFGSKLENDNNNPTTTETFEMPLTGLIGVEGAVGVFLDPAVTDSPQVGGFTATAPTN